MKSPKDARLLKRLQDEKRKSRIREAEGTICGFNEAHRCNGVVQFGIDRACRGASPTWGKHGPPYWLCSDDGAADNYYEAVDLAWNLRGWWDEPKILERLPADDRINFLRMWVVDQERKRPGPVGAKHPLLSLCGDDLVAAWGPETRFVWSWRSLEESISGLKRRGWFRGFEASLQRRLWDALNDFDSRRGDVVRLDWTRVKLDPIWATRELASLTGLEYSDALLQGAAGFIRKIGESTALRVRRSNEDAGMGISPVARVSITDPNMVRAVETWPALPEPVQFSSSPSAEGLKQEPDNAPMCSIWPTPTSTWGTWSRRWSFTSSG